MNFFSFEVPTLNAPGAVRFAPGFFNRYNAVLCKTPVAAKPHTSKEHHMAWMIHPLDTSLATVESGVFTALAIIGPARVVPVEFVVSKTFLIEFTMGVLDLLLVNLLANLTTQSFVGLISIFLDVLVRQVRFNFLIQADCLRSSFKQLVRSSIITSFSSWLERIRFRTNPCFISG